MGVEEALDRIIEKLEEDDVPFFRLRGHLQRAGKGDCRSLTLHPGTPSSRLDVVAIPGGGHNRAYRPAVGNP